MKNGSRRMIGFAVAVGMGLFVTVWACDKKKASDSTQACDSPYTCGGFPQSTCDGAGNVFLVYEVNGDFPVECLSDTNSFTNCNKPNSNCARAVTCAWTDGQCEPKSGSGDGHVYTQKPKPTTQACTS